MIKQKDDVINTADTSGKDTIAAPNNTCKIELLASKTSSLEQQLGILSSKFESFLITSTASTTSSYSVPTLASPSTNNGQRYACESCDYEAVTKENIKDHKKNVHDKLYSCAKCEFTCTDLDTFKLHKSDTHPPVIYSCDMCNFDTFHNNQLEKHRRTKHSDDFSCPNCTFKAANARDLAHHNKIKHAPEFPCDLCSYKACHRPDLNRHLRTMHDQENYQRSRYFTNSKQYHTKSFNNIQTMKTFENTTKPMTMNVNKNILEEPVAKPVNISDNLLRCSGPCHALQKTFSHKDELNLHMDFFHTEQASSQ